MNQPTTPNTVEDFLPLPEPAGVITVGTQAMRAFTADQVRAAILADRAQRAPAATEAVYQFKGVENEFWSECSRERYEKMAGSAWMTRTLYTRPAAAEPMPASEAVGYVDPMSITNLKAGVSTNEWLWAKPEAGNVPLYTAAPVPASEATPVIDLWHTAYKAIHDTYIATFGPLPPDVWGNDIDAHISDIIKAAAPVPASEAAKQMSPQSECNAALRAAPAVLDLPPLPVSQAYVSVWYSTAAPGSSLQSANGIYYNGEQMREYGEACIEAHARFRAEGGITNVSNTNFATHAAPTDAKPLSEGFALVPVAADIDEIVTRLYRRFKEWNQRGFGPDDVTWCEVKADILAMIDKAPTAAQSVRDAAQPIAPGDVRDAAYADAELACAELLKSGAEFQPTVHGCIAAIRARSLSAIATDTIAPGKEGA